MEGEEFSHHEEKEDKPDFWGNFFEPEWRSPQGTPPIEEIRGIDEKLNSDGY